MTPSTEVLMDLRERMVRIETKLDTQAVTNQTIQDDVDKHDTRLVDAEKRLSALETYQKIIAAIGSLLLIVATFFHDQIVRIFG